MKIYRPDVSNTHYPLLVRDAQDRSRLEGLNFRKLADTWTPIQFEFYVDEKKGRRRPDVTYILPCLAFRVELQDLIFPFKSDDLEFLPIMASGEDWLIVNCLRTTNCYDEAKSLLHRDETGQIFMVQKLILTAPLPEKSELFTIDGSNRSYTYLLEPLVDRVKDLKLDGITFKEMGRVEQRPPVSVRTSSG